MTERPYAELIVCLPPEDDSMGPGIYINLQTGDVRVIPHDVMDNPDKSQRTRYVLSALDYVLAHYGEHIAALELMRDEFEDATPMVDQPLRQRRARRDSERQQ